MSLRDYQQECLDEIRSSWAAGIENQLVALPTGSGKTVLFANLPEHLKLSVPDQMLVLVHRDKLVQQNADKLRKYNPHLTVEIEAGDRRADPNADVIVGSIQTFQHAKRRERFNPAIVKVVIVDEAHHCPSPSYLKVLEYFGVYKGAANRASGKLLTGFSVGPQSWIELRGGPFGAGWVGTIEDAYALAAYSITETHTGLFHTLDGYHGIEARGWDKAGFRWKSVKRFLRHTGLLPGTEILAGGDRLSATNDHSIYKAVSSGRAKLEGHNKRFLPTMVAAYSDRLNIGDLLLADDGAQWCVPTPTPVLSLDVIETLRRAGVGDHCKVSVSLDGVASAELRKLGLTTKHIHDMRARSPKARHGSYLPLSKYLMFKDRLGAPPRCVYTEGANGAWIAPMVYLPDWAYILGFWLGDGWITRSESRFSLAVDLPRINQIVEAVRDLPGVGWKPKIRRMPGKSAEVRCNNVLFCTVLRAIVGQVCASTKHIPGDWIIGWPEQARRDLLRGMMDSDGHRHCVKSHPNKQRSVFVTTSYDLARCTLSLLRSLHIQGTIAPRKPGRGGKINGRQIIGKKPIYAVHWSTHSEFQNKPKPRYGTRARFCHDEMHFDERPIRKVSPVTLDGYVYDLEMDGHPSFVVNGLLVHNTATPRRGDKIGLEKVFDKIVFARSIREMVEANWLVEPTGYHVSTLTDISDVGTKGGDFKEGELANAVNTFERNRLVVQEYQKLAAGMTFAAFTVTIQHSKDLADVFRSYGISCEAISGETPDREREVLYRKHESGELLGLSSCQVLSEGWDSPRCTVGLGTRPTKSPTLFIQQLGRQLRPYPAPEDAASYTGDFIKKFAIWIDFCDNTGRHSIVTLPTLFGLRADFDLAGKSATRTAKQLEDLLRRTPGLNIDSYTSLRDIEALVKKVDLLGPIQIPAEVQRMSKFGWVKDGIAGYRLSLTDRTFYINQDVLGQWEVQENIEGHAKILFAGKQPEAFTVADAAIPRDQIGLVLASAKWNKEPPTEKQCWALYYRDGGLHHKYYSGVALYQHAMKQYTAGNTEWSKGGISNRLNALAEAKKVKT